MAEAVMQRTRDVCETVFKNGAAVLMARMVDRCGRIVRRSHVTAAEYSIYQIGAHARVEPIVMAGYRGIALNVDEVFFDSLETGQLWDLDLVGYNFRHEVHLGENASFPTPGARYEIRYAFLLADSSAPVEVRFYVRFKPK
jgi:hypothetical protein